MPVGFRVSIASDLEGVAAARTAFGDFATAHGMPDDARRGMTVALDELLTNAVSYGSAAAGEITIEAEVHGNRMIITLTDNGMPFDPFAQPAPDTTLSVDDRPVGGLGIHLARHLVDDISYQRRAGRNIVVLTKRL